MTLESSKKKGKKLAAAITVVWDDLVLLEVWVKYYSKYFDTVLVICNGTNEGTIPNLRQLQKKYGFELEFTEEYISGMAIVNLCASWHSKLLESHEWAMHADYDEFIVAGKDYKDLRDFMKKCKEDKTRCISYEVVMSKVDKPLDYTKPILEQRKYWLKFSSYNKPMLSRVPMDWVDGFHRESTENDDDTNGAKFKGLYMLHLKHANMDASEEARVITSGRQTSYERFVTEHFKNKKRIPSYMKGLF